MNPARTFLTLLLSLLLTLNGVAALAAGLAACPMQGSSHAASTHCMESGMDQADCCDPDAASGCPACSACGLAGGFTLLPVFFSLPAPLPYATTTKFAYACFLAAADPGTIWRPPSRLS